MQNQPALRAPNVGVYKITNRSALDRLRRQELERRKKELQEKAQAATEPYYDNYVVEVPSDIRKEANKLAALWKPHRTELCDCAGMNDCLTSHAFRVLDNLSIVPAFEGEPTEAILATAFRHCPHCGVLIDPDAAQ